MYWKKANYRFYDNAERGVNVARGLWHLRGGGSTTSDELTATRDDVIAGKTAVTSDSDDEAVAGTLADKVSDTKSVNSWQEQENNYFVDIPQGAYRRKDLNGAGGRVWVEKQRLLSDLGITAAKVANGQKIAGVTGTYKGLGNAAPAQVLAGYKFSSAALSNAPGAVPGNGGGTYTPQPWQQVHQCAGSYMTGNVVINPIPSNYLDITANQSVFLNGAFGAIVNRGWMPATWTEVNMTVGYDSGLREDGSVSAVKIKNGAIYILLTYSSNRHAALIKGSINFSKFRTIRVVVNGVTIPNTAVKLRIAITDKNKVWQFSTTYKNGNEIDIKAGLQTCNIDISKVNLNGYLVVGAYSNSSASPEIEIKEVTLVP